MKAAKQNKTTVKFSGIAATSLEDALETAKAWLVDYGESWRAIDCHQTDRNTFCVEFGMLQDVMEKTCDRCGQGELYWDVIEPLNQWRLYDKDGVIHSCKKKKVSDD